MPKGGQVTHRNFSSSITHQESYYGFDETSRVFDFASYSFDVGWTNLIYTLAAGACLLVPSEDERKNDLAGTIDRLRTTHIDLTPSTASVLPMSTVAKLHALLLGGEQVKVADVRRWSSCVPIVQNMYGPR